MNPPIPHEQNPLLPWWLCLFLADQQSPQLTASIRKIYLYYSFESPKTSLDIDGIGVTEPYDAFFLMPKKSSQRHL